jgi:hypothetical protein
LAGPDLSFDPMIKLPSVAQLTQELIRFDTTNPPGDKAACVQHLERLCCA